MFLKVKSQLFNILSMKVQYAIQKQWSWEAMNIFCICNLDYKYAWDKIRMSFSNEINIIW